MEAAARDPTGVLVLIGMVLLGVASILFGLWRMRRQAIAAELAGRWPTAKGTMLLATIEHVRDSDGPDEYIPQVRYSYVVGLQRFDGDRLRAGGKTVFHREVQAREAIAPYRVGHDVPVRYDPQRPHRSVLEAVPAASTQLRQWLVFGIFLLAAAAYTAITLYFPHPPWSK